MAMSKKPSLEVCVIVEDGDVIVQIYDYPGMSKCTVTVRNPLKEEKATIGLSEQQAAALAELLQRVPGEEF